MKDYFAEMPQQYIICPKENGDQPLAQSQQTNSPVPSNPPSIPTTPEDAILTGLLDITKETIRCFTEYAKCKEHEETERKRISYALRAIIYQIDAQKEAYLKYLDKTYEERNRLYDIAERAQKKALENGDTEMLRICYNFMLNVYNKPVEGFGGGRTVRL